MRLSDGGTPAKFSDSTAALRVTVTRNNNPPVFTQQSYTATINENLGFGNRVTTVEATDADSVVCICICFGHLPYGFFFKLHSTCIDFPFLCLYW